MKTSFFYITTLVVQLAFVSVFPQDLNFQQNLSNHKKNNVQITIFEDIESSILKGDINKISKYFSPQPYISLLNGVNGYYSSNQTFYILEDFFNSFKVVSFKMEKINTEGSISYGKGDYFYEKKGRRETAHLYITLNKAGSKWYITQISIN